MSGQTELAKPSEGQLATLDEFDAEAIDPRGQPFAPERYEAMTIAAEGAPLLLALPSTSTRVLSNCTSMPYLAWFSG